MSPISTYKEGIQKDNPTNECPRIIINIFVSDKTEIRDSNKKQPSQEKIMENLLSSLEATATTALSLDDLMFNTSSLDPLNRCPGEQEFCNLTREQYEELLYDYIFPTVPEWILIFSHIVVFLMGLVSTDTQFNSLLKGPDSGSRLAFNQAENKLLLDV